MVMIIHIRMIIEIYFNFYLRNPPKMNEDIFNCLYDVIEILFTDWTAPGIHYFIKS